MAKSTKQHEKDIVALIKEKKIMRVTHIFPFYAHLKRAQFYNLGLDKSEDIKEALETNRTAGVDYLLKKWMESDNPTLQIAAMRLICDSEEHQKLNQQYIDHTTKGDKLPEIPAVIIK